MASFFSSFSFVHQTTCSYIRELNAIAERKHGHLIETTLTLLHHAGLPVQFWLEALLAALFLINRLPHFALESHIPFQLLFHRSPNLLFSNLLVVYVGVGAPEVLKNV
ncbi:hypothetical protein U1Q18_052639 [Sarracenia purpurea var. burkii]